MPTESATNMNKTTLPGYFTLLAPGGGGAFSNQGGGHFQTRGDTKFFKVGHVFFALYIYQNI